MPNQIVHIDLNVTNITDGVKFYKLVFPEWRIEKAEGMADYYFVADDGMPDTLSLGIGQADEIKPGSTIIYINVGDIPTAMQRITGAGGKVLMEKTKLGGENGYISRFEDPFGNLIGIWSQD